jgi:hypothetical protein
MKRTLTLVMLTLPVTVAPLAHAGEQYVGISTLSSGLQVPPWSLLIASNMWTCWCRRSRSRRLVQATAWYRGQRRACIR